MNPPHMNTKILLKFDVTYKTYLDVLNSHIEKNEGTQLRFI